MLCLVGCTQEHAAGGSAGGADVAGAAGDNAGGSGSTLGVGGSSASSSGGSGSQPIASGGSGSIGAAGADPVATGGGSGAGSTAGVGGDGAGGDGAGGSGATGGGPTATSVPVRLVPQAGVSGTELITIAVPVSPGVLSYDDPVRVVHEGTELGATRRVLALHPDGSVRSVELQVELAISAETSVEVRLGEAPSVPGPASDAVASHLMQADGTLGPRVWTILPAEWLSASGVAGPLVPENAVAGTAFSAWSRVCDYQTYGVDAFIARMTDATVWLYDRGTVFYRGYARRGDLDTLATAYRETAMYRSGLTGTGTSTTIGVPGKATDLKYYYAQNLALHYLMTGDDRFRESAEAISDKMSTLWSDPGYAGGADFWTERNAAFALLAYVWAAIVTDDRLVTHTLRADAAVDAYVNVQNTYPAGYSDSAARCFAHSADSHGEPFGYFGCSPWMSAILADALDAYATFRGGERADKARQAVVKLGRILARHGRDATGKPWYWMGVPGGRNEADAYDEHWGESAYVIAMAYDFDGRRDATLRQAADELITGLATRSAAPHMRSMNWQCRSAVATPFFLGQ